MILRSNLGGRSARRGRRRAGHDDRAEYEYNGQLHRTSPSHGCPPRASLEVEPRGCVRGQPRRLREGSPFDIRRSFRGTQTGLSARFDPRRVELRQRVRLRKGLAKMFSRLGFSQHADEHRP
jgi:hypothetical protein